MGLHYLQGFSKVLYLQYMDTSADSVEWIRNVQCTSLDCNIGLSFLESIQSLEYTFLLLAFDSNIIFMIIDYKTGLSIGSTYGNMNPTDNIEQISVQEPYVFTITKYNTLSRIWIFDIDSLSFYKWILYSHADIANMRTLAMTSTSQVYFGMQTSVNQ